MYRDPEYVCHFYVLYVPLGHLDALLRSLIIGCLGTYGNIATVNEACKRFDAHCKGESTIPADLRSAVYGTVLKHGDVSTLEAMMKLFKEADLHEEKVRIMRTMGAVSQPELIKKVLEFSLSVSVLILFIRKLVLLSLNISTALSIILFYIKLAIAFLIGRKRTVNFQNQRLWQHLTADYTIIMSWTLKVTGNLVIYDRGAWFLRIIMSSSRALFGLPSLNRQNDVLVCKWMFTYVTIVSVQCIIKQLLLLFFFFFCDIQNNQGLGKSYQPQPITIYFSLFMYEPRTSYSKEHKRTQSHLRTSVQLNWDSRALLRKRIILVFTLEHIIHRLDSSYHCV